jgi:hypothetical protein
MKIWTPLCVFLFAACAATPGDEPAETAGSHNGSTSQGGAAGTAGSGKEGGSGGESHPSRTAAGAAGSDETGGAGGHAERGGSTSEGGKSGTGGAAGKGGKTGAGGSTGTGGKSGTGGKTGAGGSGTGGSGNGDSGIGGSGTGGKAGSDAGTKPTGSNHVFLLLGQSNMAGYPKGQDSDKQKNQQIQVLGFDDCSATGRKKDQWDVAVPPLHECFQGAIGPGDWFSKTIVSKYPAGDTIWLVPNAFSGEAIAKLSKGGSHWDAIVSRAKKGQEKGTIEGMLFHQGESDCGNSSWPGKVKQMYADLKSTLGLTQDVPFLAGELPPTSACSNHNPLVNQLPGLMGSFTYVISSQGLALDPADTQYHMHFDHDSQVTFGKRYADTMIKALGL